jgi:hypothetical protein
MSHIIVSTTGPRLVSDRCSSTPDNLGVWDVVVGVKCTSTGTISTG